MSINVDLTPDKIGPAGEWVDLRGQVDERGIEYLGFATRVSTGKYQCVANVNGMLALVAVDINLVGSASPAADGATMKLREIAQTLEQRLMALEDWFVFGNRTSITRAQLTRWYGQRVLDTHQADK